MLFRGSTILVVDDDATLCAVISEFLTEYGHNIRVASDGPAALVEMQTNMPHILLSDLKMPGMSGRQLISLVRHRFSAVAIIAMSGGYSSFEIPTGIMADAFYPKDCGSIGPLLQMIDNISDRQNLAELRSLNTARLPATSKGCRMTIYGNRPHQLVAEERCLPGDRTYSPSARRNQVPKGVDSDPYVEVTFASFT